MNECTVVFGELVGRQVSCSCHRPGEVEYTANGGRLVLVVRDHVEKSESNDRARATSVERRYLGHKIQVVHDNHRINKKKKDKQKSKQTHRSCCKRAHRRRNEKERTRRATYWLSTLVSREQSIGSECSGDSKLLLSLAA